MRPVLWLTLLALSTVAYAATIATDDEFNPSLPNKGEKIGPSLALGALLSRLLRSRDYRKGTIERDKERRDGGERKQKEYSRNVQKVIADSCWLSNPYPFSCAKRASLFQQFSQRGAALDSLTRKYFMPATANQSLAYFLRRTWMSEKMNIPSKMKNQHRLEFEPTTALDAPMGAGSPTDHNTDTFKLCRREGRSEDYKGLRSKHDVPPFAVLQLASHHLFERYIDYVHVYTDGSVTKETSTSAFVVPELHEEYACRLGHPSSSTTAELVAILLAVSFIKLSKPPRKWVVLSDSLAALKCIESATPKHIDIRVINAILKELAQATEQQHHIVFQWVPGHCGIKGNVLADALAKDAHDSSEIRLIPISQSDIRRILRGQKRDLCLLNWFAEKTKESILYAVDPNLEYQLDHQLPRCIDTLIHRLRLGTAYTKHFLFKIQRASSSTCACGHDDEDIPHLLLDCPKYTTHRQRLEHELYLLDSARTFSLEKILGPWPPRVHHKALKALQRFFEETEIGDNY